MVIQKFFLKLLVCLMLIATIDGIALGLLQAEGDGSAENIAENIAWVIWDIMALVAQVCSLVIQCVLWLFGAGDPAGCMWNIVKCAGSLIYHCTTLLVELILSPANILQSIVVGIFHGLGWSTSYKEMLICWEEATLDADGNIQYYDQSEEEIKTHEECKIEKDEYVALQDIPVLGHTLKLINVGVDFLENLVMDVIGNPDTHRGGLYEIVNFKFEATVLGVTGTISMPGSLKDMIYGVIDPIISTVTWGIFFLTDTWHALLELNILGYGFLQGIVYDAIHWIFDFLPQPADTRKIFWGTFGLSVPDLLKNIGGPDPITEPPVTQIGDEGVDER